MFMGWKLSLSSQALGQAIIKAHSVRAEIKARTLSSKIQPEGKDHIVCL